MACAACQSPLAFLLHTEHLPLNWHKAHTKLPPTRQQLVDGVHSLQYSPSLSRYTLTPPRPKILHKHTMSRTREQLVDGVHALVIAAAAVAARLAQPVELVDEQDAGRLERGVGVRVGCLNYYVVSRGGMVL